MFFLWKNIFCFISFFWYLLNCFRIFICNILLLLTLTLIIFLFSHFNYNIKIPNKGALLCDFGQKILEKPIIHNKFNEIIYKIFGINNKQESYLFDIVNKIKKATKDKNITGIILSLENLKYADQSSLEYIGKYLKKFKKSNKPIYSIGYNYNQIQYFLSSYSNKIYLFKNGSVNLNGISINKLYFKSFLKKLKINTNVFRIGKYKSAVEPFIRNNMSPESKYLDKKWINQLWIQYLKIVSFNRKINIKKFFPKISLFIKNFYKNNGEFDSFALKNHWIDKIVSRNSFQKDMIKFFGKNKYKKTFNYININDYNYNYNYDNNKKNNIAIICINGIIMDNYEDDNSINAKIIAKQIRHARLNPYIKAIVLRINSPGGNVSASEIIEEEIKETKSFGKPVIVSMGGMAASGGYWISAPANYIFASSSTITGSIGIFSIINTFENTLKKIGIYNDGISTYPLSNIISTKNLPEEYKKLIKISINNKYNNFIKLVSLYRNKNIKKIKEISQGKIWTGKDAVKNGLVDEIGDIDDAINKASILCKLKKYNIIWYYEEDNIINNLLNNSNFLNKTIFMNKIFIKKIYNNFSELYFLKLFLKYPENKYAICIL